MKLELEYRNFKSALLFFIEDKNPVLASNDAKLISYFIGLKNFKKGFDYYELVRHSNGSVYFRMVTMLGFRTIVETGIKISFNDFTEAEWQKKIFEISMQHFAKEEYKALAQGYVKKSNSGCFGTILLFIFLAITVTFYLII